MKTFTALAALAVASQIPATQAWWDNGHMLVGEVATQLMAPADVTSIRAVLHKWEDQFVNTDKISTAAIWPDLIKCTSVSDYCQSVTSPSFTSMGDWHYVDLPLMINGAKFGGLSSSDLALFNFSLGGSAIDQLEAYIKTMATTKSVWAVNIVLRNFIHFFGDLHQPLHAVAGINKDTGAAGDGGGNSFVFQKPCTFSNLHALWDAAGGLYSQNNWSNDTALTPAAALAPNATHLISLLPLIADSVSFDGYKNLNYKEFQTAVLTTDKAFRKVALDSYQIADAVVYKGLDLTFTNGAVPCPPSWYVDWAGQFAQYRIALAGKRLSVLLTQFAKQIRAQGLDK